MHQNEPHSYASMIRGSKRIWLVGSLALLCLFLVWHQSRTFSSNTLLPGGGLDKPTTASPEHPPENIPFEAPTSKNKPLPAEDADSGFNPPPPVEDGDADFDLPSPTPADKAHDVPFLPAGDEKLLADAPRYIESIMDPSNNNLGRLTCPALSSSRYSYLQSRGSLSEQTGKYFIALNLHECAALLPRLMGSIVEAIKFLGPENCVLSIVEGRSDDGTYEILKTLAPEMEKMGTSYYFNTSDINPKAEGNDRIEKLAELRNLAIAPLVESTQGTYPTDTTVLFINDVSICTEDILEIVHQKRIQNADMICAMDWIFGGSTFYDVWVSRSMVGDQFFEIPQSGVWDFATNLFWNVPKTKERFDDKLPFQVFSCWNGAVAFTAQPLLEHKIKFRSALPDECYLGEPTHFCKDMWYNGYGKIAVVPTVNLAYADDQSLMSKNSNGWTGRTIAEQITDGRSTRESIDWVSEPPALIKCVPSYPKPSWVKWNQALKGI